MGKTIELCSYLSCTQCHACESVCPKGCISFIDAPDGFKVPHINREICVECGLCMNSCHQLNRPETDRLSTPVSYAAWTENDSIREESSSGGVFTALAESIINQGGVVFGAIMDDNLKVRHVFATSMEEIALMRGSKYVQSDINGIYNKVRDFLKDGRMVLFTGTPCQIAGLYAFLKKEYENLYTCDLICHGVPSQRAFDIYCAKIKIKRNNPQEVRFRYTKGWGFQMAYRSDADKWKNISPRKSYYLRAFFKGIMFNKSCYSCQYAKLERIGDFTLADYWGIGESEPFGHSVKKGLSLLLINSSKARVFLEKCKGLFLEKRPLEESLAGNHNLAHCSEEPVGRDCYFEDSIKLSINELSRKYGLMPNWRDYIRPIKRKLLG